MSFSFGSSEDPRSPEEDPERTLKTLATLLLVALVVTTLYVGREIFVPIAIAILVSFVLSPPILMLRGWGFGRFFSTLAVILAALVIAFSISAVLTRQISDLSFDLPRYQATIGVKVENLRDAAANNALFTKISAVLENLGEINLNRRRPSHAAEFHGPPMNQLNDNGGNFQEAKRPIPVQVYPPELGPFALVQTIAGNAISPLQTTGITVIFVVFILLQREDLRNRLIKLVGTRDLQRTTLAMNDAAIRLSQFFLVQTLLNAAFGVIVSGGLFFIGVPSPILWGVIAFLFRFVPYIGAIAGAGFPLVFAAAVDPGWGMALETLALFLTVEFLTGQIVEPWLIGHKTGISPIAVVVAATFWTSMWGPVGLVLSTPLTLFLVVLGRHVKELAFLDVIFGDAPPLTPVESFYQRMLVGDVAEAADQANEYLKAKSLIEYFDNVALPALSMAQADLCRGALDSLRQSRIKETIDDVIEDLSDHVDQPPTSAPTQDNIETDLTCDTPSSVADPMPTTNGSASTPQIPSARALGMACRPPILCIAGRSDLEKTAAALFAVVLKRQGLESTVESARALTLDQISHIAATGPRLVCLSYLDVHLSAARARFSVRRLRRHVGTAKILICFWRSDPAQADALRDETKADFLATSFNEALAYCLKEAR